MRGSDSEARGGSGLGSGCVPTWPAHLIHVEPQGQQRDAEAALGAPQVGHGGHMQRFDLELKAGGELWAPLRLRPPSAHRSPSGSCRGRYLQEARLCSHPPGCVCAGACARTRACGLVCGCVRPAAARGARTMLEWVRRGMRSLVWRYRNLLIWEEASRSRTSSSCTMNTWRDSGCSSSSRPGATGPGSAGYASCWKLTCGAHGGLSGPLPALSAPRGCPAGTSRSAQPLMNPQARSHSPPVP